MTKSSKVVFYFFASLIFGVFFGYSCTWMAARLLGEPNRSYFDGAPSFTFFVSFLVLSTFIGRWVFFYLKEHHLS